MRIVTTEFEDFYVAYADMFQYSEELNDYMKEIVSFFHDKPVYAFFNGSIYIYCCEKRDRQKIASDFIKADLSQTLSKKYNRFTFNLYEKDTSMKICLNRDMSDRTKNQLTDALKFYSSRMLFTPFDIIFV